MAELQDLIGSILRDISHSRVMSDLYSREVSLYYENDAMLRHFSVPRADISDIELELKFAFEELKSQPEFALQKRISYQIMLTANEITSELKRLVLKNKTNKQQEDHLTRLKYEIHTILTDKVTHHFLKEIKDSDREQLSNRLFEKIVGDWGKNFKEIQIIEQFPDLQDFVKGKVFFMCSMLEFTIKTVKDFMVDIAFESDRLKRMPDEILSSLKMKIEVKNYKWIKTTGEEDKEITRRLIEE